MEQKVLFGAGENSTACVCIVLFKDVGRKVRPNCHKYVFDENQGKKAG